MAGIDDMVKSKADSLKGKKAKPKKIDTPPTDTNVKPLPKDLQKALKKQLTYRFICIHMIRVLFKQRLT